MKEALSQTDIKYDYVDITSGMGPLKQFLKLRDHHPAFEPIRQQGRVGVPSLYVRDEDGTETIYFGLPDDLNVLR